MSKHLKRSQVKEWMDLGYYMPEEYAHCLEMLDRVGRILGGDSATLKAFSMLKKEPKSILDVGCGGGHFTIKLAKRLPKAQIVGIDIAPEAIEYAQKQLREKHHDVHNVIFTKSPTPSLPYLPKTFDVVTSTLVCHHLNDHEITSFLQDATTIARHAVILNDLHRHPIASAAFRLIAPILFPNDMVAHDGLLSIQRSFVRDDWHRLFSAARIPKEKTSLTWHWAFRWVAVIFGKNDGE